MSKKINVQPRGKSPNTIINQNVNQDFNESSVSANEATQHHGLINIGNSGLVDIETTSNENMTSRSKLPANGKLLFCVLLQTK